MSLDLIPLFVDGRSLRVTVTGASRDAFATARRLAAAGAAVRVVSPDAEEARSACSGCECEHVAGPPAAEHLEGRGLLVAASDAPDDDAGILAAAAERGILTVALHDADSAARLGSSRSCGGVAVAATTSGRAPVLEERLLEEASRSLVPDIDRLAEILGGIRHKLEERYPDEERRQRIWEQVLDSPVLALLQAGDEDEATELAERMAWGTG